MSFILGSGAGGSSKPSGSLWNDLVDASGVGFSYNGGSSGSSSSNGGGGGSDLWSDLGGWENPGRGYDWGYDGGYDSGYDIGGGWDGSTGIAGVPAAPVYASVRSPVSSVAPTGLAQSPGQMMLPSSMEGSVFASQPQPQQNIIMSSPPIGTAGSTGSPQPVNSLTNKQAGLDAWEAMAAERENRPVRVVNLFGEEYDKDAGGLLALADNQLAYVGNTPTNDAYIRDAINQGKLSMDEAYSMMHRPQSMDDAQRMDKEHPDIAGSFYDSTVEKLDDGTPNYWKMTADSMTGTQYRHYRDDLGMGGRDDIDDNAVYSKRREAVSNGFIPFMPDESTYSEMMMSNVVDVPSRLGNLVSNLRQIWTPDYDISYIDIDGNSRTASGKDFDKKAPAMLNQYYNDYQHNQKKFLSAPTDGSAYTAVANRFSIPDASGETTYHYGHVVDASDTSDGLVKILFSDGSSAKVTPDYIQSVLDSDTGKLNIPFDSRASLPDDLAGKLGPGKHYMTLEEFAIPDENGNVTYHYSMPKKSKDDPDPFSINATPDGYTFTFQDDSSVTVPASYFESVYNRDTGMLKLPSERVFLEDVKDMSGINVDPNMRFEEPETMDKADVVYVPDLVMSDGSRISLKDAERIMHDRSPEDDENRNGLSDDDIRYNFRSLGENIPIVGDVIRGAKSLPVVGDFLQTFTPLGVTSRPQRLGGGEIFTDDGIDLSNLMNNAADWTLGSLPISAPGPIPWIYSASNGLRAGIDGTNPSSYDPVTDSYRLNTGYWDDDGNLRYGVHREVTDRSGKKHNVREDDVSQDTRIWSGVGNMAVPITEQLVGPIGKSIVPLEKLASKFPAKSALGRLAANGIVGAIGEGVEEVLGGPFEEITQYGLRDAYASPQLDPNTGKPKTDASGHEMRQHDTSPMERLKNFQSQHKERANDFTGGMIVDAAMQLPGTMLKGVIPNAIMQDRARHFTGVPLYIAPEEVDEDNMRDIGEGYASLFDGRLAEGE